MTAGQLSIILAAFDRSDIFLNKVEYVGGSWVRVDISLFSQRPESLTKREFYTFEVGHKFSGNDYVSYIKLRKRGGPRAIFECLFPENWCVERHNMREVLKALDAYHY